MFRKLQLILMFSLIFSTSLLAIQISGTVRDLQKQTGINNAKIVITSESGESQDTAFTDAAGNWVYDFSTTAISADKTKPQTFSVYQNYPNPFNPSTRIQFSTADAGLVRVQVHNVLGQLMDETSRYLQPGQYDVKWYGMGSAGVYFYTIKTATQSVTRKMIQLDGGNGRGLTDISNSSIDLNTNLAKTNSMDITLIYSKFGYVADTSNVEIQGGEYFETKLETIHSHALMVDLHNDILERMIENPYYHLQDRHTYYQTDIPRLQDGAVDVQFFVVWVSPSQHPNDPYQQSLNMVDLFTSELNMNPETIQQVRSPQEALQANENGKIAAVMAVEGGHSIENSIDKLKTLYNAGMRYLTITWNNSTDWAVSAQDNRSATVGLSDFGRKVIRTLDTLGVMIDISHTGIKTIEDILEVTTDPIIATHSGVRSLRDKYRNLYDHQIQAIANSGGVVGIVFYPPFLGYGTVDIQTVIEHIDYIVNLVGIDYVAIGSDFDGVGDNLPVDLQDVTDFPDLTLELLEHGYSQQDVEKILGKNFMRVFEQVCGTGN